MRYGMSMLNNLHYIQNNGEKAFLAIRIKNMPVLNVISQELYTTIIVFIANRRKDRMK